MNKFKTPLEMLQAFLQDEEAWDMFIEGPAGTGKTTSLCELVKWATEEVIREDDIGPRANIVVCAHTHKACGVLRSVFTKAGLDHVVVKTLHSFLNKRPTINQEAKHIQHLESSLQMEAAETVDILFIDEFSMVGEKDLMDLRALQDPEYEGDPITRIVWIGDPFQLPPVKDQQNVVPHDPYHYRLTKVHRTDGPLLQVMAQLIDMLNGGKLRPLKGNEAFIRESDIEQVYDELKFQQRNDIAILAYTNRAVQQWNAIIQGREEPELGDWLFCHTLHRRMQLIDIIEAQYVTKVDRIFAEPLTLGSKYKTLEFLLEQNMCDFYLVADENCQEYLLPAVFGTNNYKIEQNVLGKEATSANKIIEKECNARNATEWSRLHPLHKLSRRRALAWRKYLAFKDTIHGFDFPHAMTIHKSQGSTFETVLLDSNDLNLCRLKNFEMYLRLFYVGLSRASYQVYCND